MNKKLLIFSILAVFMLLAIAFTSTVTSDISKPIKKESPLFGIRTRRAIKEKIGDMLRRFVGERVFFLPFQWILLPKILLPTCDTYPSCVTHCYPFYCKK